MKHHPNSPSVFFRRELCHYSIKENTLDDIVNEYSSEGTILHNAIAVNCFDGLNEEQQYLVGKCIDFKKTLINNTINPIVYNEYKTKLIIDGIEKTNGTIDYLIIDNINKKAILCDWKTGVSEIPPVNENWQLALYSLMIYKEFNVNYIESYIFQPRKNISDFYCFKNFNKIEEMVKKIIAKCEVENPAINPGEKQCQYCKLKQHLQCPALKQELVTIDKVVNLPEVSDDLIVTLFERGKNVNKFIDAINDELKRRIKANGSCGEYTQKEYQVKEYIVKEQTRTKIVKVKK